MKRLLLILGCLSALGCDRSLEEMLGQRSPSQPPQVEESVPAVETSVAERGKSEEESEVKLRPEIYSSVKRALVKLRSGLETGVNRNDFVEALQNLITEVTLLEDEVKSAEEKELLQGYQELVEIYKDSQEVWDVQISFAQMKFNAKRYAKDFGTDLHKTQVFDTAIVLGIPLEGLIGSKWMPLGLGGIVDKYKLPVTKLKPDSLCGMYKTPHYPLEYIPKESMQLIWRIAGEKAEQLTQRLKSDRA